MIEKAIRFDEGGEATSAPSESTAETPATPTAEAPARYNPAADSNAAYSPAEQAAAKTAGFTYSTGQWADPNSTAYEPNAENLNPEAKWYDPLVRNAQNIGNIASMFVPALRVPMMLANSAKSISDDSSAGNVLGTLASAPLSMLTKGQVSPGVFSSLFKGDVGGAAASQVVGSAMGPAMREVAKDLGPQTALALNAVNTGTGATKEAQKSIASQINSILNSPSDQSRSFASAEPAAPQYSSGSHPVSANIASILGVSPVVSQAKGKAVPLDIVQQLMAMQKSPGNLKSVPASTGGNIDDLIRLTRS